MNARDAGRAAAQALLRTDALSTDSINLIADKVMDAYAPGYRAEVLAEAAAAIQAVIDADRAKFPARSNDRTALGGARQIVLGLLDHEGPHPTWAQRCSCGGQGITHFHADRHEPIGLADVDPFVGRACLLCGDYVTGPCPTCAPTAIAAIARVRSECDRLEAAVRANPQGSVFDGAYLAPLKHIRAALYGEESP